MLWLCSKVIIFWTLFFYTVLLIIIFWLFQIVAEPPVRSTWNNRNYLGIIGFNDFYFRFLRTYNIFSFGFCHLLFPTKFSRTSFMTFQQRGQKTNKILVDVILIYQSVYQCQVRLQYELSGQEVLEH